MMPLVDTVRTGKAAPPPEGKPYHRRKEGKPRRRRGASCTRAAMRAGQAGAGVGEPATSICEIQRWKARTDRLDRDGEAVAAVGGEEGATAVGGGEGAAAGGEGEAAAAVGEGVTARHQWGRGDRAPPLGKHRPRAAVGGRRCRTAPPSGPSSVVGGNAPRRCLLINVCRPPHGCSMLPAPSSYS